jgi:hypothetical protein
MELKAKNLREYLEAMNKFKKEQMQSEEKTKKLGYYYSSQEEFILQNGQEFKSQQLTEEEKNFVIDLINRNGIRCKQRECFANAQRLAIDSDKIKYVEGYANPNLIPVSHAWNLFNGKVVDLTWIEDTMKKANSSPKRQKEMITLGEFSDKMEYFGVIIPTKIVCETALKNKEYNSLIDDWMNHFPLLKNKFEGDKNEEDEKKLCCKV